MKPLYPAVFESRDAARLHWAELPKNLQFYRHVRNICLGFPSLVLAYAARPGLAELAHEIAEGFTGCGINVFMPGQAAPLCALSQAMGARNLPIGLYLDADDQVENLALSALSSHGGPFDQKDVIVDPFGKGIKSGVIGETDIERAYVTNLAGLADRFIEKGTGFSAVEIPFAGLESRLRQTEELAILFQHDPQGPVAKISPDGQGLSITEKDGRALTAAEIARLITAYLTQERLASGTVIGPAGEIKGFAEHIETLEVDGSLFDLNHRASYTDLLVGWWHNGTIAHQGSSCFGDAILSAVYFLESRRCASGA